MILKTLARGLAKLRNELKTKSQQSQDITLSEVEETIVNGIEDSCPEDDIDQHAADLTPETSIDVSHNDRIESHIACSPVDSNEPMLKTLDNLYQEIDTIYEKAVEIWNTVNADYPSVINSHILDTYLKVLCSVPPTKEAFDRASTFFREKYTDCPEGSRGQSYLSLLAYAIRSPDVFVEYGPSLWKEFLVWDSSQESKLLAQRLTETEKEQIRVTENRDRDSFFMAFIWMVRGYTRAGNTDEALAILKSSQEFRSLEYLRPVFFRDIWVLVKRARDDSEDGKWKLAQELSEICSTSTIDPIHAIQKSIKQRLMPQNWWGWKAVGLDEVELKRLQKKNLRMKQRARQIVDSKRKPAYKK
jgi:hypothetical protein